MHKKIVEGTPKVGYQEIRQYVSIRSCGRKSLRGTGPQPNDGSMNINEVFLSFDVTLMPYMHSQRQEDKSINKINGK
jgi:hypothetical protein